MRGELRLDACWGIAKFVRRNCLVLFLVSFLLFPPYPNLRQRSQSFAALHPPQFTAKDGLKEATTQSTLLVQPPSVHSTFMFVNVLASLPGIAKVGQARVPAHKWVWAKVCDVTVHGEGAQVPEGDQISSWWLACAHFSSPVTELLCGGMTEQCRKMPKNHPQMPNTPSLQSLYKRSHAKKGSYSSITVFWSYY